MSNSRGLPPAFSSGEYRRALGAFATGVTVITTRGPERSCGMTANAVTSLSLEPPLVLVCVREKAEALGAILANGSFAVNILGRDQEWLSRYFASPRRPRGDAAFDEVRWTPTAGGAPVLDGVVGHLDCRVAAVHSAGDHVIVIGAVADLSVREGDPPLLFVHGRYASLAA